MHGKVSISDSIASWGLTFRSINLAVLRIDRKTSDKDVESMAFARGWSVLSRDWYVANSGTPFLSRKTSLNQDSHIESLLRPDFRSRFRTREEVLA